eukprot:734881-Rhodomonas_salina.1
MPLTATPIAGYSGVYKGYGFVLRSFVIRKFATRIVCSTSFCIGEDSPYSVTAVAEEPALNKSFAKVFVPSEAEDTPGT